MEATQIKAEDIDATFSTNSVGTYLSNLVMVMADIFQVFK